MGMAEVGKDTMLIGMYQVNGQRYSKHLDSLGQSWDGSRQLPTIFVDASSHREAAEKARMFSAFPHGGNLSTYHQDTNSYHKHEIAGSNPSEPAFWGADIPADADPKDW